jgi:hypothetical protein
MVHLTQTSRRKEMTPMRSKRLSLAVGPARSEPPYLPREKED